MLAFSPCGAGRRRLERWVEIACAQKKGYRLLSHTHERVEAVVVVVVAAAMQIVMTVHADPLPASAGGGGRGSTHAEASVPAH